MTTDKEAAGASATAVVLASVSLFPLFGYLALPALVLGFTCLSRKESELSRNRAKVAVWVGVAAIVINLFFGIFAVGFVHGFVNKIDHAVTSSV